MASFSHELNEDSENVNLLMSTPVRKICHSLSQNLDSLSNASIDTPKGTKIRHPFLTSIVENIGKPVVSPDIFNNNREYPKRDSSVLSPDIIGNLFPQEININEDIQHSLEEPFFSKYQKFFDHQTAKYFTETMKQSPEPHDSGIGLSMRSTEPSLTEVNKCFISPISLISRATLPLKYKRNRAEFQFSQSPLSVTSFEDFDYSVNRFTSREQFESTQFELNKARLADNVSMRQQSAIESPMFYEDPTRSFHEHFLRSSPNVKCNALAMNDINISPIKHSDYNEDDADYMETDDEFSN